jgi:hypothetical protein
MLRLLWAPPVVLNVEERGPHPDYGFALLPGASGRFVKPEFDVSFRHTAQRMRGDKIWQAERAPGVRSRILFLGDSFTYGTGNEESETFVSRLTGRWPEVEIINTGCPGYCQIEELAVLDKLGTVMRPDISVVMFFWNDVSLRSRTGPNYALNAEGKVRRVTPPDVPSDPLKLWPAELAVAQSRWKSCYLFELLRETWRTVGRRYGFAPRQSENRTPEEKEDAWKRVAGQFRLMKLRANEIGTRLVVVCIPEYCQVNPAAVSAFVKPLHYEVQDRLSQVCADLGIEYYDPRPVMRAAFEANGGTDGAKSKPLYHWIDRHLAPFGNQVMAGYLEAILEPLLPPKPFAPADQFNAKQNQ